MINRMRRFIVKYLNLLANFIKPYEAPTKEPLKLSLGEAIALGMSRDSHLKEYGIQYRQECESEWKSYLSALDKDRVIMVMEIPLDGGGGGSVVFKEPFPHSQVDLSEFLEEDCKEVPIQEPRPVQTAEHMDHHITIKE